MGPLENAGFDTAVAGEMTPNELGVCQSVRHLFNAVLERKLNFGEATKMVWRALHALERREFDLPAAMAGLDERQVAMGPVIGANEIAEVTLGQRQFIEDVDGMIDFAIRNGWGFQTVLSILGHDLSDLLHYDSDLDRARADCWTPKSSGWAKMNSASFGQSDEQGD